MNTTMNDMQPPEAFEQIFTITFSDGSQLSGLKMNGNTFISDTPVNEEFFVRKLDSVTFSDGHMSVTHGQMALVGVGVDSDGKYRFELRDLSENEKMESKFMSEISYIAMMADVELLS